MESSTRAIESCEAQSQAESTAERCNLPRVRPHKAQHLQKWHLGNRRDSRGRQRPPIDLRPGSMTKRGMKDPLLRQTGAKWLLRINLKPISAHQMPECSTDRSGSAHRGIATSRQDRIAQSLSINSGAGSWGSPTLSKRALCRMSALRASSACWG